MPRRHLRIPALRPHPHNSAQRPLPLYSLALLPSVNAVKHRNFTGSPPSRAASFDTLKIVQRLESEGFTPAQSQAVMELLKEAIEDSILGLTRTMVTREEQDKVSPRRTE